LPDEAWATAAQFRYIDPRGRTYVVLAEPDDPMRFQRVRMWQGFRVDVYAHPQDEATTPVTNWFMVTIEVAEGRLGQRDPTDRDIQLKWLRALRRYALNSTLAALDAGTLTDADHTITSNMREELSQWLPRRCEFMVPDVSGTLCGVNARDDAATTQSICDACTLPDEWERCARVTNPRTHPVRTDQEGIIARECTAQCDAGKQPSDGGGVPHQCRWGELTPRCFEPQLLQAQPKRKPGHMGLGSPDQD